MWLRSGKSSIYITSVLAIFCLLASCGSGLPGSSSLVATITPSSAKVAANSSIALTGNGTGFTQTPLAQWQMQESSPVPNEHCGFILGSTSEANFTNCPMGYVVYDPQQVSQSGDLLCSCDRGRVPRAVHRHAVLHVRPCIGDDDCGHDRDAVRSLVNGSLENAYINKLGVGSGLLSARQWERRPFGLRFFLARAMLVSPVATNPKVAGSGTITGGGPCTKSLG